MNVDDGLEDIRWIRGLGGEKLPAASNALLPHLKRGQFFAIGEGSRFFVACFLHSSAQMFLYQTPGRRPPPTSWASQETPKMVECDFPRVFFELEVEILTRDPHLYYKCAQN